MSWLIVGIFYLLVRMEIYLKIALTQFKKRYYSQKFFYADKRIFRDFDGDTAVQMLTHFLRHFQKTVESGADCVFARQAQGSVHKRT